MEYAQRTFGRDLAGELGLSPCENVGAVRWSSYLGGGSLDVLSPQQITSCDQTDLGCDGGNPGTAYAYVMSAGGIEGAAAYPYTSGVTGETGSCKFRKSDVEVKVKGWSYVSQSASQEKKMLKQVQQSPISVCVDATIWQTYVSGVVTTASGCGDQLDHCVQVAGFNAEENYWIV